MSHHIVIDGPPSSGRTRQAIDLAAELQDHGCSVAFVVPNAQYLNHLFPRLAETLDMSRVAVVTQGKLRFLRGDESLIIAEDYDRWEDGPRKELWALHSDKVAAIIETS